MLLKSVLDVNNLPFGITNITQHTGYLALIWQDQNTMSALSVALSYSNKKEKSTD